MIMDQTLGMSVGHAEMLAFCEDWLHRLEGERLPVPTTASA
jgi:hypothetical protein